MGHLDWAGPLILTLLVGGELNAQAIRGVVTDRDGGRPIAGAVVQLLDSAGAPVSRALTSETGEYWVTARRAGAYRLRTLRIGFRPQTSDLIRLSDAQQLTYPITAVSFPVSLDTVRVAGRNVCRASGDTVTATYTIWEQVRTALSATMLVSGGEPLVTTVMGYERAMDPTFPRVRRQSAALSTAPATRPWRSLSADSLRRFGYVMNDVTGARVYLAPDIDALLSRQFLEDHCFRLGTAASSGLIALEFEPTRDRKVAEIRGTVEVDRATAELRRLEFFYVNLSVPEEEAKPRGEMEFLRLSTGAWAIKRWFIRIPVIDVEYERPSARSGVQAPVARAVEIKVAGGELVLVLRGADTVWARAPLVLQGSLTDSATKRSLSGARVSLRGTQLAAVSGKDGDFSIPGVLPGEYTLDVRTASLDSIEASFSTGLAFADGAARHQVRVLSASHFATRFCSQSSADTTEAAGALIMGMVRMEGDTVPPWNVNVTAYWAEKSEARSQFARTDANGRYRICHVPANVDVTLRTALDDTSAAPAILKLPLRARFQRVDITIARPAAQVGAMFAGSVVADWTREPVADAEVTLMGLGLTVRTNAQGRFRITGIATGAQRVQVRKVGFGAVETEIVFESGRAVARQFSLGRVVALAPVTVQAERYMQKFEEHRQLGLGQFLTRADLAKAEGRLMSGVLGQVPGVDLVNSGHGNHAFLRSVRVPRFFGLPLPGNTDNLYCAESRFEQLQGVTCNCYAQVYLDKMLMNPGRPTPPFDVNTIAPEQIEAIEYFASHMATPMEYQRSNSTCGVMVIHTRRSP